MNRSPSFANSWVLSALGCTTALLLLVATGESRGQMWHWFLLPTLLCGIIVGEDLVRWLRGELDVFDPIGLLGLYGLHFFFLAPLLHMRWGFWMDIVPPPPDWRPWLGGMAWLNVGGLLVYRITRAWWTTAPQPNFQPNFQPNALQPSAFQPNAKRVSWRLEPHRFTWTLLVALPIAAALQVMIYAEYGGVWGYIQAVETEQHAFLGVSRIAIISESFPILLLVGYVVWRSRTGQCPSWSELLVVACVFVTLKMLFGGLHGSRSNVVYAVFWGAGMVHFCVRPIPRRLLFSAAACLLVFVYLYGFYKSAGVAGLKQALESSESRVALEQEIKRPIEGALLGDLGRSDLQAYVLYRLMRRDSDYQYGIGRTYYGTLVSLVPGPLWRNRPATKVKEGTDALFGRGAYRERHLSSTIEGDRFDGMTSKVFGLGGETMLNFGPYAIPFAFGFLGVVVGWTHSRLRDWSRRDPRRLFLPLMTNACLIFLYADSDNVLSFLEGDALFPFLVISWASFAILRPQNYAAENTLPEPSGMQAAGGEDV